MNGIKRICVLFTPKRKLSLVTGYQYFVHEQAVFFFNKNVKKLYKLDRNSGDAAQQIVIFANSIEMGVSKLNK